MRYWTDWVTQPVCRSWSLDMLAMQCARLRRLDTEGHVSASPHYDPPPLGHQMGAGPTAVGGSGSLEFALGLVCGLEMSREISPH